MARRSKRQNPVQQGKPADLAAPIDDLSRSLDKPLNHHWSWRMQFECGEHAYSGLIGSDIQRDGMYLEISNTAEDAVVLEVFFSDQTNGLTLTTFRPDLPLELVEWAIQMAKQRLPVTQV